VPVVADFSYMSIHNKRSFCIQIGIDVNKRMFFLMLKEKPEG
jgi:hypothetical protein